VQKLGPGELFGEIALLTTGRRTADVVAQSDVTLMVLERQVFEYQVARNPADSVQLLRLVRSRWAKLDHQQSIQCHIAQASTSISSQTAITRSGQK
jgi:CRP-like cAMP-binding protein